MDGYQNDTLTALRYEDLKDPRFLLFDMLRVVRNDAETFKIILDLK